MSADATEPTVVFPEWFDVRAEAEMADRGYFWGIAVETEPGMRYPVTFLDPMRLRQDLADDTAAGAPYFAEPGLIVVPEVTTATITLAVRRLAREGYFRHLRPM